MGVIEAMGYLNPTSGDEVMVEVGIKPDGSSQLEFFRILRIQNNKAVLLLGPNSTHTVDADRIEVVRRAKDLYPKRWR